MAKQRVLYCSKEYVVEEDYGSGRYRIANLDGIVDAWVDELTFLPMKGAPKKAVKEKVVKAPIAQSAPTEQWTIPPEYKYELPWSGRAFGGDFISLDTETEVLSDLRRDTPRAVLGSASDGTSHCILTGEQFPAFLLKHRQRHFVFWNVGFDYRVIQRAIGVAHPAFAVLPGAMKDGRVHDAMLLEQLVRLARGEGESMGEGKFFRSPLDKAAVKYGTSLKISKDNPYRMTFADLWKLPTVLDGERGYYDYAVADTIATAQLWNVLYPLAIKLAEDAGVSQEKIDRYGPLTELIQAKAAVALAQLSMNGIGFDAETYKRLYRTTRFRYLRHFSCMQKNHPELLKRYSRKNNGGYRTSKKTGCVQFSTKLLREHLAAFAKKEGFDPPRSAGKQKLISTSERDWLPYKKVSPLINAWIGMKDAEQHIAFFTPFKTAEEKKLSRIHGNYNTLVRTGRISANDPNVTQYPKGSNFRDIFVAPPGKKLITIDYSFIELCTLAATCKHRYGKAKLADVIDEYMSGRGVDPHVYTAAMLRGLPVADFCDRSKVSATDYKKDRQAAKAVNFGLPGGLGPDKLVAYAKANYGVTMTVEEATAFKKMMLEKIYPEWEVYLGDSTAQSWSINLNVPLPILEDYCKEACRAVFHSNPGKLGMFFYCTSKLLRGEARSAKSNEPYSPDFVDKLWQFLNGAIDLATEATAKRLRALNEIGTLDGTLYDALYAQTAVTLTGRVRAHCGYTNSRNTPFQGLAADGIKLAMYDLIAEGYKVCLLVHDELVVEVDESNANKDAEHVMQTMVYRMEEVMDSLVPASCSHIISSRWEKG